MKRINVGSFGVFRAGEASSLAVGLRMPRRVSLLMASVAWLGLSSEATVAGDCNLTQPFAGDGSCTNSGTFNSAVPGQATIAATGTLDLVNTAAGQIGAGSNASAVYAAGGLTLDNAGRILTLAGGSNTTISAAQVQAGTVDITNSGLIGDELTSGGGTSVAIRVGFSDTTAGTTFTLDNTATGTIRSTVLTTSSAILSYAGTVAIANAGTISSLGQSAINLNGFTTASLTNSGTITGSGFYGLVANSAGSFTFSNSGTLTSAGRGIWLLGGVIAQMENSGSISGSAAAMRIENGHLTLTNDGSITATLAPSVGRGGPAYNPAIHVMSGSSLTLTNRGTVSALGAGVKVDAGAESASIVNSGTIEATASTPVTGVKISGIYLDSTIGGTSVTNSGTITGTDYGVYLNSGAMTLNNSGTISGGIASAFLGAGDNTLNIGTGAVFTNGIDYNSTTGNTTNVNSGSFTVGVKNYIADSNTINLANSNSQLVTSGLDDTGSGSLMVIDHTSRIGAADAAAPVVSYASRVLQDILQGDGQVQANDPMGAAELHTVWARGFGGTMTQGGTDTAAKVSSGGAVIGHDLRGDDLRFGVFAGLGHSRTSQPASADRMSSDTAFAGVYGRWSFGPVNLDATLSGGRYEGDTYRFVNAGAEIAHGAIGGDFLAAELALGRNFDLGGGLHLTATGRMRHVGTWGDAYTETGSTQNVSYGASYSETLETRAEVRLDKRFKGANGETSSLYLSAAAISRQSLDAGSGSASVLGASVDLGAGPSGDKTGVALGAGFFHEVERNISLYGAVDGTRFFDGTHDLTARGGVQIRF